MKGAQDAAYRWIRQVATQGSAARARLGVAQSFDGRLGRAIIDAARAELELLAEQGHDRPIVRRIVSQVQQRSSDLLSRLEM